MGSYPMRGSEHDFDADASNKYQDNRSFQKSGLKAGVENGLSMVESLPRGAAQPEQQTSGNAFRQQTSVTPASSDLNNGKKFQITY